MQELLITKILHDLSSSISAVSNGLQLIGELEAHDESTFNLISRGATVCVSKIIFFKYVYGASTNAEVKEILENYLTACNMLYTIHNFEALEFPMNKIFLGMAAALCSSLAQGSTIDIYCATNNLEFVGNSKRRILEVPNFKGGDTLNIYNIFYYWVYQLCQAHKLEFHHKITNENQITLQVYTFNK